MAQPSSGELRAAIEAANRNFMAAFHRGDGGGVGWGWELVALVEGAVLTLYAVRQLEPGPGYLAFFVLVLFAFSAAATSDEATLVGWPLALAIATGLAAALRAGTKLTAVWTVSEHERRFFGGATCGPGAMAATLLRVAGLLGRPVVAWVTRELHGRNLWQHGREIMAGRNPGRRVVFLPGGRIPPGAVCSPPGTRA